ncbi:MAG: hypothetical protein JWQ30_1972, partial [Sediminibacterium sp.]|nr:hypothetical protein [Sediminibacterium sp.]
MWKSYHTDKMTGRYLYKFLSLNRLEYFLQHGAIWFSRADQFADKMECVHINDLLAEKPDFAKIESRKKMYLISCWYNADHESLALWDTYATEPAKRRTVAIRFERKQLVQLFKNTFYGYSSYFKNSFWHGGVVYRNLVNADLQSLNGAAMKHPSFRKEAAFSYEKEYRFVMELHKDFRVGPLGSAYHLGDVNSL